MLGGGKCVGQTWGVSGLVCKEVLLVHGLKEGLALWSGLLSGTPVMMMASASHRHRECFIVPSSGIFLHIGFGFLAVSGGPKTPWTRLNRGVATPIPGQVF